MCYFFLQEFFAKLQRQGAVHANGLGRWGKQRKSSTSPLKD
jgi:hypothetical protein